MRRPAWFVLCALLAFSLSATTFVVPSDDALFDKADAVVVARVVSSAPFVDASGLEWISTTIELEEVIKGPFLAGERIATEAVTGHRESIGRIQGSPRYADGSRVLLFLSEWNLGRWATVDLAVGKFEFVTDSEGRELLVRSTEIAGWDQQLRPFVDRVRTASGFLEYLRALASGDGSAGAYFIETDPDSHPASGPVDDPLAVIPPPASDYLIDQGIFVRWNSFPAATTYSHFNSGLVTGAVTAIDAGMNGWTGDPGSNIVLTNGGAVGVAPAGLFGAPDSTNSIVWESPIPGTGAYNCAVGGVLGVAGPRTAAGLHVFDGQQYLGILEGDVAMNVGLGACTAVQLPQNVKDLATMHEVGHTLNLRHSDRSPDDQSSCVAPLDCEPTLAIMRAFVNGALTAVAQPWDQRAVRALYPAITITAPTSVVGLSVGNAASAASVGGATYTWAIDGGSITSGQGTSAISFTAGAAGTTMLITLNTGGTLTASAAKAVSADFLDVPNGNPLRDWVNTIARNGVTGGCATGLYCPNNPVLRSQMAVFLLKSVERSLYVPPAATGTMFTDVPQGSFAAAWIEQLAQRGITGGCGGGNFCPNNSVTRSQMAVFLLKTLLGSGFVPPAAVGIFGDVPAADPFAPWIELLYDAEITGGCQAAPLLYCPNSPVTRGQMAVFLTKTFLLR